HRPYRHGTCRGQPEGVRTDNLSGAERRPDGDADAAAGTCLEPAFRPADQRGRCSCRPAAAQAGGRGGKADHPDRPGRRLYLRPRRRCGALMLPRPGPASLRLTLAVAAGIILISALAMVAQYRLTRATLEARQV